MNKESVGIKHSAESRAEEKELVHFRARLHERGMRVTPQKLAVYQVLRQKNYHPTPEMVFAEVRREYPMLSRGTVYQILDQFSRIGVIRRMASGENRQRFDGKLEPHAHFVCETCGRIDDIEDNFVEAFRKRFARKFDFHIRNHYFEFSGLCARCAQRPEMRRRLE